MLSTARGELVEPHERVYPQPSLRAQRSNPAVGWRHSFTQPVAPVSFLMTTRVLREGKFEPPAWPVVDHSQMPDNILA